MRKKKTWRKLFPTGSAPLVQTSPPIEKEGLVKTSKLKTEWRLALDYGILGGLLLTKWKTKAKRICSTFGA